MNPFDARIDARKAEAVWERVRMASEMPEVSGAEPEAAVQAAQTTQVVQTTQTTQTTQLAAMPEPADADALLSLIADEKADHCTYLCLARRLTGADRAAVLSLAADEGRHARRLTASYYLLTGEKPYVPSAPAVPCTSVPALLRDRYEGELAGAAAYAALAQTDPDRVNLFTALAADEAAHAETVLALLEKLL